ncbi:MAG: sulfatase [Candidatus Auribacterota bacterium]|nr:sulfatase [Candidatus Auribacterota bacterium]
MMIQLSVYMTVLVFLLLPAAYGEKDEESLEQPNVVFILLDAARADHFSGYGYDKKTTPRIDAIGRGGAVFLKNFVPATETYESLPRIFTSRYFSEPIFQMDTWSWGTRRESPRTIFKKFDDQQVLFPNLLSDAGYRTAFFHNHPWFMEKTDLARSFDESFFFPTADREPIDDQMVDAVLSWIAEHKGERFFLYYHIMSPHQPYPPKDEDLEFIDKEELNKLNAVREKFKKKGGNARGWTKEELELFGVMYDSNLKHTDGQIGRLYDWLVKLGLAKNTLCIITSDHGELLGQHGNLGHGGLPWEGLIHVPLIMVYPPGIPPGRRIAGLTESIDIMPTILDICNLLLPPGKSMDGESLKKLFNNPHGGKEAVFSKDSIRTEEYKYLINKDYLFDLRKDPGETMNISSGKPVFLKKELKGRFNKFMKKYRERYRDAVRNRAPKFSFYYPIFEFKILPQGDYETYYNEKPPWESLNEDRFIKPWILNKSNRQGYLLCLPKNGKPPPLAMSARIPNGSYRIQAFVAPMQKLALTRGKTGFRARFADFRKFQEPGEIILFEEEGEDPAYYLDYGPVTVSDETFSIELDFSPPEDTTCILYHIKFIPIQLQKRKPDLLGPDEINKRRKDLRSLGYFN